MASLAANTKSCSLPVRRRAGGDVRPLVRLSVQVIVEQRQREQGTAAAAGAATTPLHRGATAGVREARGRPGARQPRIASGARRNHDRGARAWLAGHSPARGDRPRPGSDFNRKGSSAFAGKIGQKVAARGVTVVDDGTMPGRRGSLSIDDEGNPTQRNILIEDGVLRGYMQDSLNARLMGVPVTGNGRRESFAHVVMPRMTNTYMLNGDKDPKEILASVKKACTRSISRRAGRHHQRQVRVLASEAYMIEDGKVSYRGERRDPDRNGPDALTRVSMIGNDLALDTGVGTAGRKARACRWAWGSRR